MFFTEHIRLHKVNTWLTRLISFPGDDYETLVIKKTWIASVIGINLIALTGTFIWYKDLGIKSDVYALFFYFIFFCCPNSRIFMGKAGH